MDGAEDMPNLENVCRLCLDADDAKSPIFDATNLTSSLADKIHAYLAIQVSANDRISTFICSNCVIKVNKWHSYKEACQRSQEKLLQWLSKQTSCNQTIQIKDEPVDLDYMDNIEILTEHDERNLVESHTVTVEANGDITNEENHALEREPEEDPLQSRLSRAEEDVVPLRENNRLDRITIEDIKEEPMSDEESDSLMDHESLSDTVELVPNPLARAKAKDDRIMEADSTQKFHATTTQKGRKKMRRIRTRTHFQGKKLFKRKCAYCRIYLHSKYSFEKHMERFHDILPNNTMLEQNNTMIETKPKPEQKVDLSSPKLVKKVSTLKPIIPVRTSARIAEAALQQQLDNEEMNAEQEADLNLTSSQLNIISQLKTYSCYTCQQYFSGRRSTLNHIRQHIPNLRPYTCIACLTKFDDRLLYKEHCSVSLECAMKIAQVVPKFGTEKYFTCNMCLEAMPNRQELLDHLSQHANKTSPSKSTAISSTPIQTTKRQSFASSDLPSPYMGGDPIHNHECDLCGMIYKHEINMQKHHNHCASLPPHARACYRCVHCGMTFLVFKKFQSHLSTDHRRKDMICQYCNFSSFSPDEYLEHYETHRGDQDGDEEDGDDEEEEDAALPAPNLAANNAKPYKCALCSDTFNDLAEYTEHRNLHLKVKIYSCVICRNMFSSAATLEAHMKDHGIQDHHNPGHHSYDEELGSEMADEDDEGNATSMSDPGGRLPTCPVCYNSFANTNNVIRHLKNVHRLERSICTQCYEVFETKEELNTHMMGNHIAKVGQTKPAPKVPSQRPIMECPSCFKVYTYESALHHHCRNVHGFNYKDRTPVQKPTSYKCEICHKTFKEEFSMRIHKTWHYRSDSRLAKGMPNSKISPMKIKDQLKVKSSVASTVNQPKPAKARKSFPNPPKYPATSSNTTNKYQSIQCQVCDSRFSDVTQLRKHLWEVHCARNKQEKPFIINELQCELCTTIFENRESLDEHMEWHKANPILSNNTSSTTSKTSARSTAPATTSAPPAPTSTSTTCGVCGKVYPNRKKLYKHKKIHKIQQQQGIAAKVQGLPLKKVVTCGTCNKVFSSAGNLSKHRAMTGCGMNMLKLKKEAIQDNVEISKKKTVHCLICKVGFPNMRVLYQHKQIMHNKNKPLKSGQTTGGLMALTDSLGGVICNICGKRFTSVPALKQHHTIKHKTAASKAAVVVKSSPKPSKTGILICTTKNCRQQFTDQESLTRHEMQNHSNTLYSCQMCERHFFDKSIIVKHVLNTHKSGYQAGVTNDADFFEEVDLNTYEIKDLTNPRECPVCRVRYPNTKALKIHYYKYHDKSY